MVPDPDRQEFRKSDMNDTDRMKELVSKLNEAAKAYYAEDREIMSNLEYDRLYDELVALEEKTGVVLAASPTQSVGYEAVDELPKERHESPMLSLGKTKSREELADWLGDQKGLLSWKLDGLTIVLTYRDGKLFKAVTRGNGEIGEVITPNAKTFVNVPLQIPYQGELILRGEAVITYADFEKINGEIEDVDARYKNPRNLCSGSVRQLNSQITAQRKVHFFAFALVRAEGVDFKNSREEQFIFLQKQGFETVEYKAVTADTMQEAVAWFEEKITDYPVPSDGLVLLLDDIAYGESLGRTAKFPRNAIAFKWADEQAETTLREVEWSASRTGLINPVAIFDPVELEGTTVSRASVHNVSIVKELKLGFYVSDLAWLASFATFENVCYLTQNGAGQFVYLLIRGFGTGAMHIVCGSVYGRVLRPVWGSRPLRAACLFGLLCVAIIYHAIYNLLVSVGGTAQLIAYAIPLLTALCFHLLGQQTAAQKQ